MAKKRLAVHFRLPAYAAPRTAWQAQIHANAAAAFDHAGATITEDDHVQLDIQLYLKSADAARHDVDNRLKDILDALQGLAGGFGKKHRARRILLPNDAQVHRVVIEKTPPPRQSRGLGHVRISRYAATHTPHR
ncbi:MAG TPA: hypothetical protein VJL28_09780 [Gemmatimonadaceae bacterium]|nr:hypothetical protein [Gemmatimonadaceae bacterium]